MTLTQTTSAQVHGKVVLHMVISTVLVFWLGIKQPTTARAAVGV